MIEWTRRTLPAVTTFDLNTLSQSSVTGYAIDLLNQSDQILMIIEIKKARNLQLIKQFVEALKGQEGKQVKIVLNGHRAEELVGELASVRSERNLEERKQKQLIRDFFRPRP